MQDEEVVTTDAGQKPSLKLFTFVEIFKAYM